MKKIALIGMAVLVFSAGTVFAQMSQSGGMMGSSKKGCMMTQRNMPMMSGMQMPGMMGNKMIATSDGGIVVMSFGKLYKYDKDLNLIKQVEIPFDTEHMNKMMMNMKNMRMMWDSQNSESTESESNSAQMGHH